LEAAFVSFSEKVTFTQKVTSTEKAWQE